MRETAIQTLRSVNEEGKEGIQVVENSTSPAGCGEDHGELHCAPAAGGGLHVRREVCAQQRLGPHGKPILEQAPGRACGHMERGTHTEEGLLAGHVILWGTHTGAGKSVRRKERQSQGVMNDHNPHCLSRCITVWQNVGNLGACKDWRGWGQYF